MRSVALLLNSLGLFCSGIVDGQVACPIAVHREAIIVSLDGYVRQVSCEGISKEGLVYQISYNELESLEDIEAYYLDFKGKWKALDKDAYSTSDALTSSFYSGTKLMRVEIPPGADFKINYTQTCEMPEYLGSLNCSNAIAADSILYSIDVRPPLLMEYDLQFGPTYEGDWSDKSIDLGEKGTHVEFVFVPSEKQNEHAFMRLAFKNKEKHSSYEEALLDWYRQMLQEVAPISQTTIDSLSAKMVGIIEPTASDILSLVQAEIDYIDIENGLGAFCPRSPDQIWEARKGDCKDMAYLIKALLSTNDITSYLALSASLDHRFDMDFPSISSADHMVCVIPDKSGSYILMDATDDQSTVDLPSSHTQGRKIFVLKEDPEYYTIPLPIPESNLVEYGLVLDLDNLHGRMSVHTRGYSAKPFLVAYKKMHPDHAEQYCRSLIEDQFSSISPMVSLIVPEDETFYYQVDFSLSEKRMFSMDNVDYLKLNFLPQPWNLLQLDSLKHSTSLDQTMAVNVSVKLESARSFEILEKELLLSSINEGDGFFESALRQIDDRSWEISYDFEYSAARIPLSEQAHFISLNNEINNFLSSYVQIH